MQKLFKDPVGIFKGAFSGFLRDDGTGVASESAYRIVFALPPLIIFFASLSAMAAEYTGVDTFDILLERAEEGMPEEVFGTLEMIFETVEEQSGVGVLSIGLVLAMWSGSNAIGAVIKAINRAYGQTDERGFIVQRALALGLLIGLSVLMISSLVLVIFGQNLGEAVAGWFGFGSAFTILWNVARFPLIILLLMTALAGLYRFAPARRVTTQSIVPGAVVATILWIVASYAFSIYLSFSDPGSAYGVLGGVIVLLLFLYLSSIVIVFGAEINAELVQQSGVRETELEVETHPVDVLGASGALTTPPGMAARIVTWVIIGGVFVGGLISGFLKKRSD